MLEKLAKQTAVYGISTIVVRFLSYLLTPYYTRVFGQETYGVVTDIYALIPLALTLLTMGMESSYFRFSAKAEEAGGDVKAAKRRLFATTWGVTSLAAAVFFLATAFFRDGIARMMGEAYVAHPEYVVWVGLIILFDVWACIPFSRLREQGRAMTFVGLKAMNVVLNVALAFGFGAAGLFATDFGVGWVFVANLIASVVTWLAILGTADRTVPKINWALLAAIFAYSLPLYCGDVHGCIVDLDFCNHIMINPLDQKVTFYNSPTMGFVKIFDNLENLITYMNNGYILNIEKKKMLELKNNNAIISKTSQEISQEVGELIKIDIKNSVYSISNYMRQIQRLFDSNILRDWNEDIISIQKKVSGT